jgi:hypothetical protein
VYSDSGIQPPSCPSVVNCSQVEPNPNYNIPNYLYPILPCTPYPSGLTAEIIGTPTQSGSFSFGLNVSDSQGRIGQDSFTIKINNEATAALAPARVVRTPNGAVHLILDNSRYYSFTSWDEFLSLGYRIYHIKFSSDSNLLSGLTRSASFERPSGTVFKYTNNAAIYYLTKERCKQIYSSWPVFRLWGQTFNDIVFMPGNEEFPTCASARVQLPQGTAVRAGGPTVYVYDNGTLRPVASLQAFNSMGYKLTDIVNLVNTDLFNYPQGPIIN